MTIAPYLELYYMQDPPLKKKKKKKNKTKQTQRYSTD